MQVPAWVASAVSPERLALRPGEVLATNADINDFFQLCGGQSLMNSPVIPAGGGSVPGLMYVTLHGL